VVGADQAGCRSGDHGPEVVPRRRWERGRDQHDGLPVSAIRLDDVELERIVSGDVLDGHD
jgi:hypothetical protein